MACADEFISRMPDGYDTDIEQGGANVSGGQKQRLCLSLIHISPSSIMNKMQKRGLPLDFPTMQANIMDVAGVRVI